MDRTFLIQKRKDSPDVGNIYELDVMSDEVKVKIKKMLGGITEIIWEIIGIKKIMKMKRRQDSFCISARTAAHR